MKKPSWTPSKEIIFGTDTPACMTFLKSLQRQQVIDQQANDQKLINDTLRKFAWDGPQKNIVINKWVFDAEVDSTYWKNNF